MIIQTQMLRGNARSMMEQEIRNVLDAAVQESESKRLKKDADSDNSQRQNKNGFLPSCASSDDHVNCCASSDEHVNSFFAPLCCTCNWPLTHCTCDDGTE